MSKAFFITGTDTEVGKTHVCEILLNAATNAGKLSIGLKPVAAGAERNSLGEWQNEDALRLMSSSSLHLPYKVVNPICVPEPLSPHIAAKRAGVQICVNSLLNSLNEGLSAGADVTLVEGAGGWRVPINREQTLADLAKALNIPVILVVGMRLGCINHALLSAEAIRADGLELFGWIANQVAPDMPAFDENMDTLVHMLPAPLLGVVPHGLSVSDKSLFSQFDMMF